MSPKPPASCHVVVANPLFDFALYLKNSIDCDKVEYLSPPPSPEMHPTPSSASDALDDLSPLTTPEPSPVISASTSTLQPLPPDLPPLTPPQSSPPSFTTSILSSQPPAGTARSKVSKAKSPTTKKPSKKPEQRKARQYAHQKAWRQKKRVEKRDAIGSHYTASENAYRKYVETAETIECSWDMSDAAVSSTAFVATRRRGGLKKEYGLEDLVGQNSKFKFRKIEWDGRRVTHTPTAIIDAKKRLVGIMAGRPDETTWPVHQSEGADALESCRKRCHIPKTRRKHRRGAFVALNCGVSHGGGQKEPGNLQHDAPTAKVLEELNMMEPFKRLAGFSSSVMATWAPDLHKYYSETIDALHSDNSKLKRIFSSSVFSAVTYNMGPQTVCYQHTDPGNLAFGVCSVTPLGEFDHTKSGHLILWDLHLVIEFPAGSTILIPSAIVSHSNVKVASHERRYSFAQYTAGALFRWVENQSMTRAAYLSLLSEKELEDDQARNTARWEYGLSLIPTYTPPEEIDDIFGSK